MKLPHGRSEKVYTFAFYQQEVNKYRNKKSIKDKDG